MVIGITGWDYRPCSVVLAWSFSESARSRASRSSPRQGSRSRAASCSRSATFGIGSCNRRRFRRALQLFRPVPCEGECPAVETIGPDLHSTPVWPALPLTFYHQFAAARGLNWTPLRKEVLAILWRDGAAWGTYKLADEMRRLGVKAFPNSIYRTLRTLEEHQLIVPIHTARRYLISPDPCQTDWAVLNCGGCGLVDLIAMPAEAERMRRTSKVAQFTARRMIVECTGTCRSCAEGEALGESAEMAAPAQRPRSRETVRARAEATSADQTGSSLAGDRLEPKRPGYTDR
jgi:Fur family zinc uptake transcriptional regulator